MFPGHPIRCFTREEATTLSRALDAAARGASFERQIYMSPIASDYDFDARIGENGIIVTSDGFGDIALDWDETRALAQELASFGSASAPDRQYE